MGWDYHFTDTSVLTPDGTLTRDRSFTLTAGGGGSGQSSGGASDSGSSGWATWSTSSQFAGSGGGTVGEVAQWTAHTVTTADNITTGSASGTVASTGTAASNGGGSGTAITVTWDDTGSQVTQTDSNGSGSSTGDGFNSLTQWTVVYNGPNPSTYVSTSSGVAYGSDSGSSHDDWGATGVFHNLPVNVSGSSSDSWSSSYSGPGMGFARQPAYLGVLPYLPEPEINWNDPILLANLIPARNSVGGGDGGGGVFGAPTNAGSWLAGLFGKVPSRVWSVLQIFAGAVEVSLGVTATGTGYGAPIGGVAIVHGLDTITAGWLGVLDGQYHHSYTYQGVEANYGPTWAFLVDAGIPLLAGGAAAWSNRAAALNCFAAGTPLLTPTGARRIETFRIGDLLLSRGELNPDGPVEVKQVEEVFVRLAPILHLHVRDQVIRTTGEHLMYVYNKTDWLPAGQLQPGDLLLSDDGQLVPVGEVYDTGEWEKVYNLRVAEHHTYFVGSEEWGFSVWAHNSYTLTDEVAARWFPNSTRVEYGEGLSVMAQQLRAAGGVKPGVNVAVIEYVQNGATQTKLFKSVSDAYHSEEVALKWLNKVGIERSSITRLYSEYHPCTGCNPLVRAAFPNAEIQFSWPYRSTSLADYISNIGRAMKAEALKNL